MKDQFSKTKLFLILFSAIMLFSFFSFSVLAVNKNDTETEIIKWTLSDDGKKLLRDDMAFSKVNMPWRCYLEANSEYNYACLIDSIFLIDEYSHPVSDKKDSETVWLYDNSGNDCHIYATAREISSINEFAQGKTYQYKIKKVGSNNEFAIMTSNFANNLDYFLNEGLLNVTFDIKDIKSSLYAEIIAQSKSGLINRVHGGIFLIDGDYYYLNFDELKFNHFDAKGNLTYTGGEVSLLKIKNELLERTEAAINSMSVHPYTKINENDKIISDFENGLYGSDVELAIRKTTAIVTFWIIYVVVGFLVPIAPLIVGFSFARSEKRGNPKHWYAVAYLSLAWLALSLILAIILIFG